MQNSISLAWLIGNEGTPGEIRFELTKSESILGRGSDCEVQVDDKLASRKHAVIYYRDGGFEIEDLGSSNGTFVNNKTVTSGPIFDGDQITIGETILQFRIELDPDATIIQMRVPQETIAAARKTIPLEHDFVLCSQCGQKNPAKNKVCSKCNVVLPQLPENFQKTLGNFKMAQADFIAGQLSEEEYHAELAELVVQDQNDEYWMLGVESGDWYWFDGEEWNKKTPPLITPGENQVSTPITPEESQPPPKHSRAGRWGAFGLWFIGAIIVLALGVYSVMELISFFRGSQGFPLAADYQEVTTDDSDESYPTATPEVIPATEQALTEINIRPYNPGIDSSLLSFTADAYYKSDQSSSEYFIYEGNFSGNTSAILIMGWCAIDQDTLNSNMSGIQMAGMFNNQVIPQNSWTQENIETEGMFCRYFRAVVEGLSPGTQHYIWSSSHNDPVFDGWETYPPGTWTDEYIIVVAGQ